MYIGIDVGGTKIAAALVKGSGEILSREKLPTPPNSRASKVLSVISALITELSVKNGIQLKNISGIGIGIPGIVDATTGKIKITVNVGLSGLNITSELAKKYHCVVAAGNDVNLGILGEKWLGAARGASNVVGLFPGTGIGGGIIANNALVTGAFGAAAELGHMIMQINGPACSCGNRGCLEALAGRWALERDIRKAVSQGENTIITQLTKNNLRTIKSKIIREALKKKDPLTVRLVTQMSQILGQACVNLRHIFDPEIILFGGGLIEACGKFILPRVKKTMQKDPFFKRVSHCDIVSSALGDNAVILGAVALVKEKAGDNSGCRVKSPVLNLDGCNAVTVNGKIYEQDMYIRANGKIKKRGGKLNTTAKKTRLFIEPKEIKKICRHNPEVLIIGTKNEQKLRLPQISLDFLKENCINLAILPLSKAVALYNRTGESKAILLNIEH